MHAPTIILCESFQQRVSLFSTIENMKLWYVVDSLWFQGFYLGDQVDMDGGLWVRKLKWHMMSHNVKYGEKLSDSNIWCVVEFDTSDHTWQHDFGFNIENYINANENRVNLKNQQTYSHF